MVNAGKNLGARLQALEMSESTLECWRSHFGGMKREQAKRFKYSQDENLRLKRLVADRLWTSRCESTARSETGEPFSAASGGRRGLPWKSNPVTRKC